MPLYADACLLAQPRGSLVQHPHPGSAALLSATDPRQVCAAIDRFTATRNEHPVPFEWTKAVVHPVGLNHRYAYKAGLLCEILSRQLMGVTANNDRGILPLSLHSLSR